ncbi:MAG: preprotein translocase subunit SecG [Thalassobaculum sp.]
MELIILTVHLMIALALIVTVLLQRSEGGGLGIGGGGGGGGGLGSFMSARGTANLLTSDDGDSGRLLHGDQPDAGDSRVSDDDLLDRRPDSGRRGARRANGSGSTSLAVTP